ncbi:hypothetical protein HOV93_25110 [Planctomycetes bacterium FF15]|uniref:Uncharacterized protein n=1 Tax=Bremerella alba TaxID=980252 RepID=A0A7V9A7G3_9BACT|nr:hypothetical protein [Bremerella alba]
MRPSRPFQLRVTMQKRKWQVKSSASFGDATYSHKRVYCLLCFLWTIIPREVVVNSSNLTCMVKRCDESVKFWFSGKTTIDA